MNTKSLTSLYTLLLMGGALLFAACDATHLDDTASSGVTLPDANVRGGVADLSVALGADPNLSTPDSIYWKIELRNEGPDAAPGVLLAFGSSADCVADRSQGGGGGDIGDDILWDIVDSVAGGGSTDLPDGIIWDIDTAGSGGGGGVDIDDDILWDIVDSVLPVGRVTLGAICAANPNGDVGIVEIMRSGAHDPDSVPGDSDPDQDDIAVVVL